MIVDVDMCTDVDDACALRIATALDDDGIIDLQGVAFSVNGPNNLDALRGFLLHEGKPDVLIGKSAVANPPEESPYWDLMAEYSDGKVNSCEAVKMYRKNTRRKRYPGRYRYNRLHHQHRVPAEK